MTSNKEDYLKALYQAGGLEIYISNKVIAEKLKIAPASVSEMMTKLQAEGLIDYKAYHGSKLTEQGLNACIDVVSSHRLWEVFLMRHLGYTWREAHEEAEVLEHVSPKRMMDRMDSFLNYPQTCPHGSIIPRSGRPILESELSLHKLSEIETGEKAVIVRITEEEKLLDYLEHSGLQIGKEIDIVSKEEYEGPITFIEESKTVCISYKAATKIYVRKNEL